MKINATIVKEDGLYGMVMPEKPKKQWTIEMSRREAAPIRSQWTRYEGRIQAAKDAAIRYEDQDKAIEVVKSIARAPIKHDFVYPLPEPLEVEQIWQFKWAGTPSENWQDCNDNDPRSTYNGKCEYRATLRISQGTDNNNGVTCPACGSSDLHEQGPSEMMPRIHLICFACKAEFDEGENVSEREEPTQEELWKEVIAGQSMEDLLKRFTITRRA